MKLIIEKEFLILLQKVKKLWFTSRKFRKCVHLWPFGIASVQFILSNYVHKRPVVKFGSLEEHLLFLWEIRRANSFRRCRTSRPIYCLTILIGTWELNSVSFTVLFGGARGCSDFFLNQPSRNQSSRESFKVRASFYDFIKLRKAFSNRSYN